MLELMAKLLIGRGDRAFLGRSQKPSVVLKF